MLQAVPVCESRKGVRAFARFFGKPLACLLAERKGRKMLEIWCIVILSFVLTFVSHGMVPMQKASSILYRKECDRLVIAVIMSLVFIFALVWLFWNSVEWTDERGRVLPLWWVIPPVNLVSIIALIALNVVQIYRHTKGKTGEEGEKSGIIANALFRCWWIMSLVAIAFIWFLP